MKKNPIKIIRLIGLIAVFFFCFSTPSAFAFITNSSLTGYSNSSLTQGLVGWWTFDGRDMIPNVRDRSDQGNHGNLTGQTATTTAPGK